MSDRSLRLRARRSTQNRSVALVAHLEYDEEVDADEDERRVDDGVVHLGRQRQKAQVHRLRVSDVRRHLDEPEIRDPAGETEASRTA